jgi:hypothetical protein
MTKPIHYQPKLKLELVPISLRDAAKFVELHHRNHNAPQGGKFAIAVAEIDASEPCGVVIVGRPVSRKLQDGWTAEATRVCTLGAKNACSMLYRAAWRASKAMGYRRLVTYTGKDEGGVSLIASGFKLIGECGGGSWSRKDRPRVDRHPTQQKLRWEISE